MSHSKLSYAERVALKRARRLNPSPQALAAHKRAAERNHALATERLNALTTNATAGDIVSAHLLAVTHG